MRKELNNKEQPSHSPYTLFPVNKVTTKSGKSQLFVTIFKSKPRIQAL